MHFYTTKQISRYLAWLSCFLPSSSRIVHRHWEIKPWGTLLRPNYYSNISFPNNRGKCRQVSASLSEKLRVLLISDALYKSSILGGFFVSGTIPLFYELTVESTYPVAEGVTTGALTLINNSFTVIFLFVLMIPEVGKSSFYLMFSNSLMNKENLNRDGGLDTRSVQFSSVQFWYNFDKEKWTI